VSSTREPPVTVSLVNCLFDGRKALELQPTVTLRIIALQEGESGSATEIHHLRAQARQRLCRDGRVGLKYMDEYMPVNIESDI
jgi:hypothetical protein